MKTLRLGLKSYSTFESSLRSDYMCLEVEFISIPNALEKEAKKQKKGIWSGEFEEPYLFRKKNK